MSTALVDVCVVGAGPAGLAAAIAARQQGMSVIAVEAGDAVVDKCCGEGVLPDGAAALQDLGVGLPSDAPRFRGIRFVEGAASAAGEFSTGAAGVGLRRTRLHRLLLDRALEAGVDCRFRTRVTGLGPDSVHVDGGTIRSRWIVGADGFNSQVRKWSGLEAGRHRSPAHRFGFRRHFTIDRAPDHVEVYWHDEFQVYVTPVGPREVGVAMTTPNPARRLDYAFEQLPALRRRLGSPTNRERGAVTGNFSLRAIHRGNVVLVGDASGAVDSIAGQGLCLAFREAVHLGAALAQHDLERYARKHREAVWPARTMARALLLMANHPMARRLAIRALASIPAVFHVLLSAHGGAGAGGGDTAALATLVARSGRA